MRLALLTGSLLLTLGGASPPRFGHDQAAYGSESYHEDGVDHQYVPGANGSIKAPLYNFQTVLNDTRDVEGVQNFKQSYVSFQFNPGLPYDVVLTADQASAAQAQVADDGVLQLNAGFKGRYLTVSLDYEVQEPDQISGKVAAPPVARLIAGYKRRYGRWNSQFYVDSEGNVASKYVGGLAWVVCTRNGTQHFVVASAEGFSIQYKSSIADGIAKTCAIVQLKQIPIDANLSNGTLYPDEIAGPASWNGTHGAAEPQFFNATIKH